MNTKGPLKVKIEWKDFSARGLQEQLQREIPELHSGAISLNILRAKKQPDALALDPAIVVAMITGGATVIAALVNALAVLSAKKGVGRNVHVCLPDGSRLDFPATLEPAQIDAIVAALQRAENARIVISE